MALYVEMVSRSEEPSFDRNAVGTHTDVIVMVQDGKAIRFGAVLAESPVRMHSPERGDFATVWYITVNGERQTRTNADQSLRFNMLDGTPSGWSAVVRECKALATLFASEFIRYQL